MIKDKTQTIFSIFYAHVIFMHVSLMKKQTTDTNHNIMKITEHQGCEKTLKTLLDGKAKQPGNISKCL